MNHELKTIQPYFDDIKFQRKKFELRRNDRNFQVGDILYLQEFDESISSLTGKTVLREVTYLLKSTDIPGLSPGFVVLGLGSVQAEPNLSFCRLRRKNAKRGKEWAGVNGLENLLFNCVELGGEVGEALDAAKKYERGNLFDAPGSITYEQLIDKMKEELADVIITADRVAECVGINLAEAVIEKFNKTSDKYGFQVKL